MRPSTILFPFSALRRYELISKTCSGPSIFGTKILVRLSATTVFKSSSSRPDSRELTRTMRFLSWPRNSESLFLTNSRVSSFLERETESSRSMITASAAVAIALFMRSGRLPGTNSAVLIGMNLSGPRIIFQ